MSVFHNGVTYRAADAHAHIYPGKIAEKATGSVGEFYHIPMQNVGLPHILAQRGAEAGIDRFPVSYTHLDVYKRQVQSLLQVSVSFMPMPGASGAQEIGFSSFFRNYFVNDDLYAAVMVWRFFTYYLVVIAGAILVAVSYTHLDVYKRQG